LPPRFCNPKQANKPRRPNQYHPALYMSKKLCLLLFPEKFHQLRHLYDLYWSRPLVEKKILMFLYSYIYILLYTNILYSRDSFRPLATQLAQLPQMARLESVELVLEVLEIRGYARGQVKFPKCTGR